MRDARTPTYTWLAHGVAATGHLAGVAATAAALMVAMMPHEMAWRVVHMSATIPTLRQSSWMDFALLGGLSCCIWALVVILYHLAKERREQPRVKLVRPRAGTIVTETLIIMPIFLLLTFGMAQLSINMIGGILANVAGYQASRSIWVWEPEADAGRMGVTEQEVKSRARVAAAMVMAPVASGEYANPSALGGLGGAGDPMRRAIAAGQSLGFAPPDLAIKGMAAGDTMETSMSAALGDSNFYLQSIRKFSRAYSCTQIAIVRENGKLGAQMTYKHFQGMPLVGKIVSKNLFKLPELPNASNGYRPGYYATYKRKFMFTEQIARPNATPPNNNFNGSSADFSPPSVGDRVNSETGGF